MFSLNNKINTCTILLYFFATSSIVYSDNVNSSEKSKRDFILENDQKDVIQIKKNDKTTIMDENNYVATTPKILPRNELSRYETGLEDYEEAVARIEDEKGMHEENRAHKEINPLVSVFDMISKALLKNKSNSTNNQSNKNSLTQIDQIDKNDDNKFINMNGNIEEITDRINEIKRNSTNLVSEGRYIKGDPLNGYYDFLITEGSYKFWAVFQLATAALIIYSTFAAIYYSKVNPLTSDYDYVDYLSRSFNGRSMPDNTETNNDANSYWTTIFNGNWLGSASHAFQFVMDSIDKVPQ